ncbi:hypothetical protein GCM10025734_17220 [Kitasatospora paranensis]
MNPARSLAPALLGGSGGPVWIHLLGLPVGAVLAVPPAWVLRGLPSVEATRAAQGTDGTDLHDMPSSGSRRTRSGVGAPWMTVRQAACGARTGAAGTAAALSRG